MSSGCSTGWLESLVRFIAAYDYGSAYDSATGVITLLDSPGPNREVIAG